MQFQSTLPVRERRGRESPEKGPPMKFTAENWRSPLFWGSAGVLIAATCGMMDGINNYRYGIAFNGMAAIGLLIAAGLVVYIPATAERNGWSPLKYAVLTIALGLTVWAAYSNYEVTQRELRDKTGGKQDQYLRASAKYEAATGKLARIQANGKVEDLAKVAEQAGARFAEAAATWPKACKKLWTDACSAATSDKKAAEAVLAKATRELLDAQSRDEAKADKAAAEAEMAAGPVTIREENQGVTYGLILLTQGGALMGGEGFALLLAGLAGRKQWKQSRRKKARGDAAPDGGGSRQTLPGNVVSMVDRRSVDAWLGQRTRSSTGGEVRGSEILRAYKRWGEADPSINAASMRKILTSILGEERIAPRTSGYAVLGLTLKSSVPQTGKKAAAR